MCRRVERHATLPLRCGIAQQQRGVGVHELMESRANHEAKHEPEESSRLEMKPNIKMLSYPA